jgi:hypothetical protein
MADLIHSFGKTNPFNLPGFDADAVYYSCVIEPIAFPPSLSSNFLNNSSTLTAHIIALTPLPKVSTLICLIHRPSSPSPRGVSHQLDTLPSSSLEDHTALALTWINGVYLWRIVFHISILKSYNQLPFQKPKKRKTRGEENQERRVEVPPYLQYPPKTIPNA